MQCGAYFTLPVLLIASELALSSYLALTKTRDCRCEFELKTINSLLQSVEWQRERGAVCR